MALKYRLTICCVLLACLLSMNPFALVPHSSRQILVNKPYENGPGGSGQYTKKIYHLGARLPAAIRVVLPKSALQVHEEVGTLFSSLKSF